MSALHLNVNGVNDLLYYAGKAVMENGIEIEVRGSKTKEAHPAFIEVSNPLRRVLLYPGRGENPFAQIFETLWVLCSPTNSLRYLKIFLPRCVDYSDDFGETWRAGYPERLKLYNGKTNQIVNVYERLKRDPNTRQAVMVLWNPSLDSDPESKFRDYPCSNHVSYLIRDEQLDCMLVMRSNDLCFGLTGINLYEFTVLQEILASSLGIKVGKYYHVVNSLHIYERHYEKMNSLINRDSNDLLFSETSFLNNFRWGIDKPFADVISEYKKLYWGICDYIDEHRLYKDTYEYLRYSKHFYRNIIELSTLLKIYIDIAVHHVDFEYTKEQLKWVSNTDLKVACCFWILKYFKLIDPSDISKAIELSQIVQ